MENGHNLDDVTPARTPFLRARALEALVDDALALPARQQVSLVRVLVPRVVPQFTNTDVHGFLEVLRRVSPRVPASEPADHPLSLQEVVEEAQELPGRAQAEFLRRVVPQVFARLDPEKRDRLLAQLDTMGSAVEAGGELPTTH